MPDESTQQEDPVEVLEPEAQERVVVLGSEDTTWELTQRPLNFFQKLELFSVLGAALDKALSGENPLDLNDLLGDTPEGTDAESFADADQFLKGIAKLVQYAPDLVLDIYCIVLGVPRGRRDMAKAMMQAPVEEGGLSDDDGFGILDTFFEQNWDVLKDFFSVRIQPLWERVAGRDSASSKPSKTTRRATPKQSKSS